MSGQSSSCILVVSWMIEDGDGLRVAQRDQSEYAEHRAKRKHRQVQRGQTMPPIRAHG